MSAQFSSPPCHCSADALLQVPKRKPQAISKPSDQPKQAVPPKKFASFSTRDSRSIESAFQKLAEEEEKRIGKRTVGGNTETISEEQTGPTESRSRDNTSINDSTDHEKGGLIKVPVNEDFLFDVDIDNRELAPAYWLGPIYEVRRASWFYHDGSFSKPCDENLATQLEEGYIKTKPWRNEPPASTRSSSQNRQRPASWKPTDTVGKLGASNVKPPRGPSADDTEDRKNEDQNAANIQPKYQLQTHRLFGAYMNSVVTYQDSTVAWILTDDFMSRMSSSVYQRFAGGGHLGGTKVARGFVDPESRKEQKSDGIGVPEPGEFEDRGRLISNPKRRSAPSSIERPTSINVQKSRGIEGESPESERSAIERRMATIVGSPMPEDTAAQEEEARKREEAEIQEDYRESDGDEQGREIEHLVLVTHGIGQRLGLKMESLNFIHDVNVLRKTLKTVYENSPDLQALNSEVDKLPKNCRIQVLPVVWRHLLDFPRQSLKNRGNEQDLSDVDALGDEFEYPKLSDITVDGVPAIRNLVEDLFLDILLYQSAYREHIAGIVQRECNRVFGLFQKRNPQFKGKVSLVGHSLGSAVMFDLLCRQKDAAHDSPAHQARPSRKRTSSVKQEDATRDLALEFGVEDFYCLGSPVGLFQMIKGRTIAGRRAPDSTVAESPMEPHPMNGSYLHTSPDPLCPTSISSPKCGQLFNIFHPTDPIAYRLEPLISPAMKALKPQPLPYVKKGIFGAPGAGLSGIGARVGQSVSGFWSNITTGVASSLLNRSLGLTHDPQQVTSQTRQPLSMGKGIIAAGGVVSGPDDLEENRKASDMSTSGTDAQIEHPATLIDTEIETLYSGFQRHRKTSRTGDGKEMAESSEAKEWQDAEDKSKQLRREEAKVRALNSNGRVDFSIQE